MDSNVTLELLLQLRDEASASFRNAAHAAQQYENQVNQAQGKNNGFFGGIGGGIAKLGMMATGVGTVIAGVRGLGDVFGSSLDEAKEWNTGLAQLDAVMTSTGGKAGLTKDQILEMNRALSAGGGFSAAADDAVLSGQNMLLTFTNIGKDVFPDASRAMLDMATKMNNGVTPSSEQLSQQAIQLGKALNDPIKGVGALARVGVSFTAQQREQIKAMVESGNTMGAQKLILAELNSEFGGSAAAAMGTFAGKQQLVGEQLNNVKQTLGEALMPVLTTAMGFISSNVVPILADFAAGVSRALDWLRSMTDGATSLSQVLFNMAESVDGPLGAVLGFFSSIIGNIETFIGALQSGQDPVQAFFDLIGNNFDSIGALWDRLGPMLGEFAGNILKWLGDMVPVIAAKLAEWGGKFVSWVMESMPGWLEQAGQFISGVLDWIGKQVGPLLAKLGEWGLKLIEWVMDSFPGWLKAAAEFIGGVLKWIVEQIPGLVAKLWEWGTAIAGWIIPRIPELLGHLGEMLLKIGTWIITEALPAIIRQLGEWGKAFLDWVGKDVLPFIGAKLGELWTKLVDWIGETASNIINEVSRIGTEFVNGIWNGIVGAWDTFTSNVRRKLEEWWNGVLNFFGIKSPSRLAAEQVGVPIVQGIQVGFEGEVPNLQRGTLAELAAWIDAVKIASGTTVANEAGSTVVGGIREGFEEAWGAFDSSVRAMMDATWGAAAARAAEIAQMMANVQASGSASSAGTGASNPAFLPPWYSGSGGGNGGSSGGQQVLDTGGIVTRPTSALLAMNRVPEAVIPLPKLGGVLGGVRVVFNGPVLGMDERRLADYIAKILHEHVEGIGRR